MKIEIKSHRNGKLLFNIEADSLKLAVEAAVTNGASLCNAALRDAKLSGADLSDAKLNGANLIYADLSDAELSGAKLNGADLSGANLSDAKLNGADLRKADFRGADLRGADLRGADLSDAELSGAKLNGAKIDGFEIPSAEVAAPLLRQVAEAALAAPECLDMSMWHTCETTHCIAGWAVTLTGDRGKFLEHKYGTENAGLLLLGIEAATHFYDSNDNARVWLQSKLEEA
jgi:hypothetical protein